MKNVLFDLETLSSRAKDRKIPAFKVKQILFELFKNQNIHWDEMTTLSKDLKAELNSDFFPISLENTDTVETDSTVKFAFKTYDWHIIESILMLHWQNDKYHTSSEEWLPRFDCKDNRKLNRITLCISSQVGCPVNCLFCVTGKLWFGRNLSWDEIISQILYANWRIKQKFWKKSDWTLWWVRNVVFMGMWEPLLNYENVIQSIDIMLAQDRLSLGRRHVTISTAGIISGIKRLITDKIDVKLAISLHAPNQELRERLMPIARTNPLSELMNMIDKYTQATDNRIFYEYIMIKGITDTPDLAHQLAELLHRRLAHVNLIPYNENPAIALQESDFSTISKFKNILEKSWITVTIRESMGRESKWACGQLWREQTKNPTNQQGL